MVLVGRQIFIEGRGTDGVDDCELRGALLELQLQLRQSEQLSKAQLGGELFGEFEVVLELVGLLLLLVLLDLGGDLHLPVLNLVHHLVVNLLLVLRLLPVYLLVFDAHLQVGVDVRLLDPGLPGLDAEGQLVVELVDELEDVLELGRGRLGRTQLEGFFVLHHGCLEIVEFGVDYAHDLVDLCHFVGVLSVLRFS